jgi:hypothetical protein
MQAAKISLELHARYGMTPTQLIIELLQHVQTDNPYIQELIGHGHVIADLLQSRSAPNSAVVEWAYRTTLARCHEDIWRLVDIEGTRFNASAAHARQIEHWDLDEIAASMNMHAPTAYRLVHDLLDTRHEQHPHKRNEMDTYWETEDARVLEDDEQPGAEVDGDNEDLAATRQRALRKIVSDQAQQSHFRAHHAC